jgi:hypothetical protein
VTPRPARSCRASAAGARPESRRERARPRGYFFLTARFALRLRFTDSARLRVVVARFVALRFELVRFERFPGGVAMRRVLSV